jgi:hypothetical protein
MCQETPKSASVKADEDIQTPTRGDAANAGSIRLRHPGYPAGFAECV